MLVRDSAGSELRLYEFERVDRVRLFGVTIRRRKVRRFQLDTGEAVVAHATERGFRVANTGEQLIEID
jgi:hypothetical protein